MQQALSSQRCLRTLVAGLVACSSLASQYLASKPVAAQTRDYCQLSQEEISQKEALRQDWLQNRENGENRYQEILNKHETLLQQCRRSSWLQDQAIWLRLYPCDTRPGAIEAILDSIVNQGYNQVYLEVFYDSQVLLPTTDNPTAWTSVMRSPGLENTDVLAQTIAKGHERGLEVYAWMFTMNFGYSYSQRPERRHTLARNGRGQTSLDVVREGSQVFIDPYNRQAQVDFYRLVQAIAQRKPDGILFDYIRYPRGSGSQSVVGHVRDLWIYSDASRQALYNRATNNQGRVLIDRYLRQGTIKISDVEAVDKLFPNERVPMWQGRTPSEREEKASARERHRILQTDLWHLAVAHAAQGVIDFLTFATDSLPRQGIPAGAVFFPNGNQPVGQRGFDSRLQPWDKFPTSLEWHAMSYGACGDNSTNCITDLVRRTVRMSPPGMKLVPAIAGVWGRPYRNRPSLEEQMAAIHRTNPEIRSISHFAYSWQHPEFDRERKFCRLP